MNRIYIHLLSTGLMSLTLHSHAATLLVGSYTDGDSHGIYRYHFDPTQGQIDATPLQVVRAANPSWLVLSEDQRQLYSVNESRSGQVSSFAIGKDGALRSLGTIASQGGEPTHASLSRDQRYLFVANYGAKAPGGSLVALPVRRDGTLTRATQDLRHAPSKVNAERQTEAHVHSVVLAPDGRHLYASDLGADKVFIYRYDGANDTQPLSSAPTASLALPAGSGPRHLQFDAKGKHAYLTLEMLGEVAMLTVKPDGQLTLDQRLPLTEQTDPAFKGAGGLHLSADGRFLYVSNRGQANQIVVYRVHADDGRLTLLQRRSAEGEHPREFAVAPDGHFLLVANQHSNEIVVIRRDPREGTLGEVVQRLEQPAPSDLKFIE
ncbi:lactonase family protein [Pseudomonas sp.]|uniref:lactonase family protein n=1 Tax=Pseudomonas sp. TaxID=306 RepID=UPI0028A77A36|nr:lactonase family protein [Pseudomonas sp.]